MAQSLPPKSVACFRYGAPSPFPCFRCARPTSIFFPYTLVFVFDDPTIWIYSCIHFTILPVQHCQFKYGEFGANEFMSVQVFHIELNSRHPLTFWMSSHSCEASIHALFFKFGHPFTYPKEKGRGVDPLALRFLLYCFGPQHFRIHFFLSCVQSELLLFAIVFFALLHPSHLRFLPAIFLVV